MTERRRARWKRDSIIVTFALAGGAYEIVVGGGRASVFTFLIGLLLSPLVLRIDESRKVDP